MTDEQKKQKEEECENVLLELIEKILESAKYELRIGWAINIFDHLSLAGIASIKSYAKIKQGMSQLKAYERGLPKSSIVKTLEWLTFEEIMDEQHFPTEDK